MDAIADTLTAPVMPWDAVICTSRAVRDTVRRVTEAGVEYFRWRFGPAVAPTLPQFPVIPLGVHLGDFAPSADARAAARAALGLAEDEVMALFVGRLSFHAKAHPGAMFAALERVAAGAGAKIALPPMELPGHGTCAIFIQGGVERGRWQL